VGDKKGLQERRERERKGATIREIPFYLPTLYLAGFCLQNPARGWLFCKADLRSDKDEDIEK